MGDDAKIMEAARAKINEPGSDDDTWYNVGDALCCYLVDAYSTKEIMKRIEDA